VPIYEFVCQNCGEEFEKIQSFSVAIAPICPRCQSIQVQRQMSRPAIHFKGSGWYINDSKPGKESAKKSTDTNGAESDSVAAPADSVKTDDGSATPEAKPAKEDKEAKETKEVKETKDAKSIPDKKEVAKASGTPEKGTTA